ncbi:MobV family relaxase [Acinetobacter sp. YH12142]|uniref:MobV family relaxase n=2 Tax=unclassified Acinetobacter TaxID=196816 RepID=UPI0015D3A8F9|nr:MobV family relaxase [Acinetobacter sp. YH12142]
MTDYVILRHAKLKSFGEIGGSLDHTYRLIDTPNADLNRADLNEHDYKKKTEVVAAIKNRIDQRVKERPGNVLCVEYLITASPDWSGWGNKETETEFFEIQKKRLIEKWGVNNVISTHIHRDETTPHLIAYIVPFDEEKQVLNCKKWLDGRKLLHEEQTEAAEIVKHLGLSRGIKHSKAEHRTIKQHYEIINQINEINEFSPNIDNLPPVKSFESRENYAKRVLEAVLPDYKKAKIEAIQNAATKKEVESLREIAEKSKVYLNALDDVPEPYVELFNSKIKETASLIKNKNENDIKKEVEEYNKKIKVINDHKDNFEYFYDYCNLELKNKNNNEKLIKKEYKKTENWLKKNDLTDKEIEKGWKNDGSQIYIDKPDFYMSEYKYDSLMTEYYNNYKNNIYKKSKDVDINETISVLKQNPENQIGKRFQNKLDDYYENFEPVINEVGHYLKRLEELKAAEQVKDAARSAQIAENERIAKEGLETYRKQKTAENAPYRASRSEVNKDQDKSFDADNTYNPFG